MKHLIVILVLVCFAFLPGCVVNFKAKELEMESRPIEPKIELSYESYEFEGVRFAKKGEIPWHW